MTRQTKRTCIAAYLATAATMATVASAEFAGYFGWWYLPPPSRLTNGLFDLVLAVGFALSAACYIGQKTRG